MYEIFTGTRSCCLIVLDKLYCVQHAVCGGHVFCYVQHICRGNVFDRMGHVWFCGTCCLIVGDMLFDFMGHTVDCMGYMFVWDKLLCVGNVIVWDRLFHCEGHNVQVCGTCLFGTCCLCGT